MKKRLRVAAVVLGYLALCAALIAWTPRGGQDIATRLSPAEVQMCAHRTMIALEDGREIVLAAAPKRCAELAP